MIFTLLVLTITAQPLTNPEVLEPSIVNEVEHALSLAPTNAANCMHDFGMRGTATDRAIKLVSMQRHDGRWYNGTNDVSFAAIVELKALLGIR